jgi:hypothetical protein
MDIDDHDWEPPIDPLDEIDRDALAEMMGREDYLAERYETRPRNSIEPDSAREAVAVDEVTARQRDAWVKKVSADQDPEPEAAPQPTAKKGAAETYFGENQVQDNEPFAAVQSEMRPLIPREIEAQYIRVDNKFYHPKNTEVVAFEDKGNKLETRSNSAQTASNMVQIAEARGWDEIKVTGSETFRREVWLAAASRGMHVKGYSPSDENLAELGKRQRDQDTNKVEEGRVHFRGRENDSGSPATGEGKTSKPHAPDQEFVPITRESMYGRDREFSNRDNEKVTAGQLVNHGPAPYKNDEKNSQSYFVTLRTEAGDKTVWGVDLERAVSEAGAKPGDKISIENQGRQQVTVQAPVHDAKGDVVGFEEKLVHRNQWDVQKANTFLNEPAERGVDRHPELVHAYTAAAAMTKKAEADGLTQDQRAIVEARVRQNIANSIERGESIALAQREFAVAESTAEPDKELDR